MISGKRCEYMTSLSFHYKSVVELQPFQTSPEANITIKFATVQPYGVLVYGKQKNGGHLAIELFNGRIRVSHFMGNHPISTIYSLETVIDGNPHSTEIIAGPSNIVMRIDGGSTRYIVNEKLRGFLNFTSPIYVGGIEANVAQIAFTEFHLRNVSSFKGKFFVLSIKDIQMIVLYNS